MSAVGCHHLEIGGNDVGDRFAERHRVGQAGGMVYGPDGLEKAIEETDGCRWAPSIFEDFEIQSRPPFWNLPHGLLPRKVLLIHR